MKRVTFDITFSRLSGIKYGLYMIFSALFDWRGKHGIQFNDCELDGDIEVSE